MKVLIATRHCDVPESVRMRAEEQAERLTRYDQSLTGIEIVFETEKHLKRVEGILSIERGAPIVTTGEGSEFRAALDQMLDRASRMLRRHREQSRDHQGPKLSESPPAEA